MTPTNPAAGTPPVTRRVPPPEGGPAPVRPVPGAGGKMSPQSAADGVAAGMPAPETGATRVPVAPVRVPATRSSPLPLSGAHRVLSGAHQVAAGNQMPAGGAHAAADALPAGPRTYTIALPAGLKLLSLNDRLHWRERNSRAQELKRATWVMALNAGIPRLERVSVVVEYQPPDRRHRDGDNISPAGKAALDGIVAAKVLAGDDKRYVTGTFCTIGEPYPGGRLLLHLTEVAP